MLISAGANVNVQNKNKMTPLMIATRKGHIGCVKELTTTGADTNVQEGNGNTALMLALLHKHADCVRQLLSTGADVNIGNKDSHNSVDDLPQKKEISNV